MPTASQKPKGFGIEMHHQLADFAAGIGGDRHGRKGVERPTHALLPSGCKDCEAARLDPCCRLGGVKLEGCPCRFHGDHLGCLVVLPQVLKSIDMAFSGNHLHHFGNFSKMDCLSKLKLLNNIRKSIYCFMLDFPFLYQALGFTDLRGSH